MLTPHDTPSSQVSVILSCVGPLCAPGVIEGTLILAHPIRDGDIVCRLSAHAFRGHMVSRPLSSGTVALGLQASRQFSPQLTDTGTTPQPAPIQHWPCRLSMLSERTQNLPIGCHCCPRITLGLLNRLLPDVWVHTDHHAGRTGGDSPGFALSLVAESTTGVLLVAETAAEKVGLAPRLPKHRL